MYTDPAKHAAITGAPVAISAEPGSPFQAFNGALTGATLQIIPQRLVIQSWRSTKFNDGDPDSTLILGLPVLREFLAPLGRPAELRRFVGTVSPQPVERGKRDRAKTRSVAALTAPRPSEVRRLRYSRT
jgi:integrase